MIFTTRPYLKYLLPIPVIFGLVVLTFLILRIDQKTEVQKSALMYLIPIILIFFFLLPFFTFKYFKTVSRENNQWIIRYPYLGKKVVLTKKNVTKIEIVKNISNSSLPSHTQINIRTSSGKSIYINSLELSNFSKLRQLITKDFRKIVEVSDFLTRKRKS